MAKLQLNATVLPNGMLAVPLPKQWQSRNVKVIVEEHFLENEASEKESKNCLVGKVSPELYGSIWEIDDVVSPVDVEWEVMQ